MPQRGDQPGGLGVCGALGVCETPWCIPCVGGPRGFSSAEKWVFGPNQQAKRSIRILGRFLVGFGFGWFHMLICVHSR